MTEIEAVTLQSTQPGARPQAAGQGRGARARQGAGSAGSIAIAALTLLAAGCGGPGDVVEIDKTRIAAEPSKQVLAGVDLRSRLGMGSAQESQPAQAPQPDLANMFEYDLPDGWEALPPTQFRLVNLRNLDDPMAEITLTFLGGNGGGLGANINRWRGQVGLDPATPAEIGAYPKRTIFGNEATYVEFTGSYQGMGGPKIEDGALYGAIFSRGGGTLFVKMTGPRETLEAQRDTFATFLDSLDVKPEARGEQPGGQSPHSTQQLPQQQQQSGPGAGNPRPSPLTWQAPAGWSEEAAPNPFREVTFRSGDVEMYISLARGGALPNINRWAGQLGLAALDDAALEALPRVPMLEREAYIYEGEGTLKGMRDPAPKPGQRMLAALVDDGGLIVTVKMTGPTDAVDAARADFMSLIASIGKR